MGNEIDRTFNQNKSSPSAAEIVQALSVNGRNQLLDWMGESVSAVTINQAGGIDFISRQLADKLEWKAEDLVGKQFSLLSQENTPGISFPEIEKSTGEKRCLLFSASGKKLHFQWTNISLEFTDASLQGEMFLLEDVTELAAAALKLKQSRNIDNLSGLKNRDQFQKDVCRLVSSRNPCSIVFIDLDRFKYYNDTLGHFTGDQLLTEIACRMESQESDAAKLYRYGGDEFALLLEGRLRKTEAAEAAVEVLHLFDAPFRIENKELAITVSIGISCFTGGEEQAEDLVQQASTAMQYAKESGKNGYQFFEPQLQKKYEKRLLMEKRLRHALLTGGFHLVYQPQVDLKQQRVVGAEALLRWHDHELGSLSPELFIPVAEESGLIIPIGDWVLEEACREAKVWESKGNPLRIGVNISPKQFQRPDFVKKVKGALERTGLPPELLDLEITENDLLYHEASCLDTLYCLKKIGVQISIDDFGTGYSSLSYLRQFPIDTLKIDKSFIREVLSNKKDQAIVTSIIQLAHNMKMRVIAEGVESKGMLPFLDARDCDEMQGFLYSRPVRPEKLDKYLQRARSRALFIS